MKKPIAVTYLLVCLVLSTQLYACSKEEPIQEVSTQVSIREKNEENEVYSEIIQEDKNIVSEETDEDVDEVLEEKSMPDLEEQVYEEDAIDLPDIIDGDGVDDCFSEEDVLNAFQATYRTEGVAAVTITNTGEKTGENKYNVNLGFFGKGVFEDNSAYYENYAIHFNAPCPDNGFVRGYLEFGESFEILNVVILDSDWGPVPAGTIVEVDKRLSF